MDFFNLNTEYDNLSNYTKLGLSSLSNFLNFLKTVHKYTEQFIKETKKSLDTLLFEFYKDEEPSSLTINFINFYHSVNTYLQSKQNQNTKLNKELVEPLSEFSSHLTSQNTVALSELRNLIIDTYFQKKKYEQAKSIYFSSSKTAQEQEKLLLKKIEKKCPDQEIKQSHEVLYNLRATAEENSQKYKIETTKTNQIFNDNNKRYFPILEKIKNNEESRTSFIKFHFEKINQYIFNEYNSIKELYTSLTNHIEEVQIETDLKHFTERFNYTSKENERIPQEELINYDIYRRNIETLNKKNKMLLQREGQNSFFFHQEMSFSSNGPSQNFIFNSTELKVIEGLFEKEEIDNYQFEMLKKKISIDEKYVKDFIDKLLENYQKTIAVRIKNEKNLERLGVLMLSILKNKKIQKTLFEINFAIAYISEKSFYQSETNPFYKVYLCRFLSEKNTQIKSKEFWLSLLNVKIQTEINSKAKKILDRELKEREIKRRKEEKTQMQTPQTPNQEEYSSIFKSVINIAGDFIFNSISSIQQEQFTNQKILIEIAERIRTEEALRVTKEFISHFSSFNVDSNDVVDIITEISSKYHYEEQEEKIKYIISIINSNMYSIKNSKFNYQKKNLLFIKKGLNLSIVNSYMNKNYFNNLSIKDNTIVILLNAMKYLDIKDAIELLTLNKRSNNIISRKFYKNVLLNVPQCTVNQRIQIWKSILKKKQNHSISTISTISTKPYEDIINTIANQKSEILETILLDVKRTLFEQDKEENRKKIKNILSAIAYIYPGINYCQGMNYIASFLLLYTNSEVEAFNIFSALLYSTEYSNLFANELLRMNKYFYVFERLIFIYMPEVFIYLKSQTVSVTYYISPWFITLFTNAYQYISDKTNPKVLIWIIDLFILDGWKAIIKIGLCLMKNFEKKILSLKYEELLHFLINDILKYDFFQTNNFEKLRRIYSTLKIENALIENIENEFHIQKQITKE